MADQLFAGIAVDDFADALPWYEKLLGAAPAFFPHDTEAVWDLGEHRWLYVVQRPGHGGHAVHTIMVDDLDKRVAEIADRGLEPTKRETYEGGARKAIYFDPEGNEISYGGVPS
jgi:hypothetical protein